MPNAIETYLYELKPSIDTGLWRSASSTIDSFIDKTQEKYKVYDKLIEKRKRAEKSLLDLDKQYVKDLADRDRLIEEGKFDEADKLSKRIDSYDENRKQKEQEISKAREEEQKFKQENVVFGERTAAKLANGLTKGVAIASKLIDIMSQAVSAAQELADKASERSNKFVGSNSLFVDSTTRDTMAKFGLSSTQAQGLNFAMDQMGISDSDFGKLTVGQRNLLNNLAKQYQESIDSIDPENLDRFNESVQNFQSFQASAAVRMDTLVTKIMANSRSLPKLLTKLEEFFESTMDFAESPVVAWFFDTFIEFLSTLLDVGSKLMQVLTIGTGGSVTNNNTTSTTTNYNTINISGQSANSNQTIQRALQSAGLVNG